jgi:threonine dehydrogenase-like Zn-dependent dehydrogenase
LHGIDLCNIRPGTTVLISGSGGIGLLLLQEAKLSGALHLTVSDPIAEKRENAIKLGADHVIDPFTEDVVARALEITDGRGFDVVIEASGNPKAISSCYYALGRGGTLQFFGTYPDGTYMSEIPLDGMKSVAFKEAKLIGIFQSPYMFHRAVDFYDKLNLDLFVENIFKPEDCKLAFETQMTGKPQKVLFDFN